MNFSTFFLNQFCLQIIAVHDKEFVSRQVDKDCDFLEQERIMDYSLLVGLHFQETSDQEPNTLDSQDSGICSLVKFAFRIVVSASNLIFENVSFRK